LVNSTIGLHVVGRRAGVVGEPRQREVGAQGVEQGQRPLASPVRLPEAVGDLVADRGQLGAPGKRRRSRRR
jgi:hypothetical protein